MDTKQDKIITIISAALAVVILVVVIACNVGNDSPSVDNENKTKEAETETNLEGLNFEASIIETNNFFVGIPVDETESLEAEEIETAEVEPETLDTVTVQAPSKYAGMFFVKVDEFLFVRADGNEAAEAVGKIYKGCGGEVLERGAEWSKIKSGNVVGYIKNEFAYFDDEIEAHESEFASSSATSTVDSLRIRNSADANSTVIGTLEPGNVATVNEYGAEWSKITYGGITGYTATSYLVFTYTMGNGITVAEEQAAIEAEAERQRLAQEAAEAEERRKQEAYQQAINNSQFVETIQTSAYNISEEDAYLIACVVSAEAGGDIYEDQLAVANVILNRLKSGRYGNTVSGVIYARGQFAVVPNGSMQRYMDNGPLPVAVQATKDAISGINNVPNYLYFSALYAANFSRYNEYTIIGAQVFYN